MRESRKIIAVYEAGISERKRLMCTYLVKSDWVAEISIGILNNILIKGEQTA